MGFILGISVAVAMIFCLVAAIQYEEWSSRRHLAEECAEGSEDTRSLDYLHQFLLDTSDCSMEGQRENINSPERSMENPERENQENGNLERGNRENGNLERGSLESGNRKVGNPEEEEEEDILHPVKESTIREMERIDKKLEKKIEEHLMKKEEERREQEEREEKLLNDTAEITRGLMVDSLKQIGCQPAKMDDGCWLEVSYQGEMFQMEFSGRYCRIWDPCWAGFQIDDPNFPKLQLAINNTNFGFGPVVILTEPDSNGLMNFHSRFDIMLHPDCPENMPYVKSILDSFFDTKTRLKSTFSQIVINYNEAQKEMQKKRRPVGFDTESEIA